MCVCVCVCACVRVVWFVYVSIHTACVYVYGFMHIALRWSPLPVNDKNLVRSTAVHISHPILKAASTSAATKKLGAFTVRDDEPAGTAGSLLFKRSSSKDKGPSLPPSSSPGMSAAAHARMASVTALKKKEKQEEEEEGHVVGSSSGGDATRSGAAKQKEVKKSFVSAPTVSSSSGSSSTAKSTGTGLKRQASKTSPSTAEKGKQKMTSEILLLSKWEGLVKL